MIWKFVNSPLWDDKSKGLSLWLLEVKIWKCTMEDMNSLEGVHGLQLMLHLPNGIGFGEQVFGSFDSDAVKKQDECSHSSS